MCERCRELERDMNWVGWMLEMKIEEVHRASSGQDIGAYRQMVDEEARLGRAVERAREAYHQALESHEAETARPKSNSRGA